MNKTFYNKIKKTMSAILAATVSLSMMAATPVYADWVENANNAEEVAFTPYTYIYNRGFIIAT